MEIKNAKFVKSVRGTNDIITEARRQIVFVGRSNVGKSSIINCLVNRKNLVKSGKLPGKTSEINFFLINDSFYFVDLPGYGYAKKSLAQRDQLKEMIIWFLCEKVFDRTVVLILDIKVGPKDFDKEMIQILLEQNQKIIIIANKCDSLNKSEIEARVKEISAEMKAPIIPCSAKTKQGREEILQKLFG